MTKRIDREGPIHAAILAYLRAVLPLAIVHHCANEVGLSGPLVARQIAKATRMGQVKGWPDIEVLPWSNVGPLFFEVKAPGGRLTPDQAALHEQLTKLGYKVAVVRSVDDVRRFLQVWQVPNRDAVK